MRTNYMSVAEKLRHYREASALSQQQVADALGINRTTYTKYETGDSHPKLKTLVEIAAILNVPAESLLPERPDNKGSTRQIKDSPLINSPIFQLSKDERGLVAIYRTLSKEGKLAAVDAISNISKNDRHTSVK